MKIQLPNYTQIPNQFMDVMKNMKHSTVKVFLVICRKTIGWHKLSDRISHSQLIEMTGMDRNTVRGAIKELGLGGWITWIRTKQGYTYDVNFITKSSRGVKKSPSRGLNIHPTKEKKEIYINIETAFLSSFKKKTGEEYHILYAKDRALMKPLITKYGEKKIIELIDLWFRDDFAEQCGYSIGGFSSCFNKLLSRSNSGAKTKEKEQQNRRNETKRLEQDKKEHPEKYGVPKK